MKRKVKGHKLRTDARDLKIVIKKLQKEIPKFKDCIQCGECCGPILITTSEYQAIIMELSRTEQFPQVAKNLLRTDTTATGDDRYSCPCLLIKGDPNDINNRKTTCMVYRKRPVICRAQAVTPGMPCEWNTGYVQSRRDQRLWKRYGELAANDRIELRPAIKEYINQWVIQQDIKSGAIETVHVKAEKKEEKNIKGDIK